MKGAVSGFIVVIAILGVVAIAASEGQLNFGGGLFSLFQTISVLSVSYDEFNNDYIVLFNGAGGSQTIQGEWNGVSNLASGSPPASQGFEFTVTTDRIWHEFPIESLDYRFTEPTITFWNGNAESFDSYRETCLNGGGRIYKLDTLLTGTFEAFCVDEVIVARDGRFTGERLTSFEGDVRLTFDDGQTASAPIDTRNSNTLNLGTIEKNLGVLGNVRFTSFQAGTLDIRQPSDTAVRWASGSWNFYDSSLKARHQVQVADFEVESDRFGSTNVETFYDSFDFHQYRDTLINKRAQIVGTVDSVERGTTWGLANFEDETENSANVVLDVTSQGVAFPQFTMNIDATKLGRKDLKANPEIIDISFADDREAGTGSVVTTTIQNNGEFGDIRVSIDTRTSGLSVRDSTVKNIELQNRQTGTRTFDVNAFTTGDYTFRICAVSTLDSALGECEDRTIGFTQPVIGCTEGEKRENFNDHLIEICESDNWIVHERCGENQKVFNFQCVDLDDDSGGSTSECEWYDIGCHFDKLTNSFGFGLAAGITTVVVIVAVGFFAYVFIGSTARTAGRRIGRRF